MPPLEVQEIRERLNSLNLQGEQFRSFKELPVMDRAFFPGGHGLFGGESGHFPFAGTLILGSNFGAYSNFVYEEDEELRLRAIDEIEENQAATWKNLLPLLRGAEIIPEECFFSNVFPVLHEGKDQNRSGNTLPKELVSRWLLNEGLVACFSTFLNYTITKMQPKLIVALGMHAARFLNGTLLSRESNKWANLNRAHSSFPEVKGRGIGSFPKIRATNVNWSCIITAIPHPSDKRNFGIIPRYEACSGLIRLLHEAANEAEIFKPSERQIL